MSIQPGVGHEPLGMPDVESGVINHLRSRFAAEGLDAAFTDRFPLDPAMQLPLVHVELPPGPGGSTRMAQVRVEVRVWAEDRVEALGMADAVRRALVKRGGFRLDGNGTVSLGSANPMPHRVDGGDRTNRVVSYAAGYDLTVRMTT